jgi:transposase InsO family protein
VIVSDNGTELTSYAIFAWARDHQIDWHYITPGKPMQNGYSRTASSPVPPPSASADTAEPCAAASAN